jgi:sulfur carrier protein
MIAITLNDEPRSFDEAPTLRALIDQLGLSERRIAVLRNGEVVHREDHEATVLADGDKVDIVHMVGGG